MIDTLRRRGATIGTGEVSVQFGRDYAPRGRVFEDQVDVRAGNAPPEGARAIARVRITRPSPSVHTVSLGPAAGGASRRFSSASCGESAHPEAVS